MTNTDITPTLPIMGALNNCLAAIRAEHPEIGNVTLVVGAAGRSGHGMVNGHFAPNRWSNEAAAHEIMISGESLARGAEATLGTLIHELVHTLANARGIKDTSRQGRYHNHNFKAIAAELGIHVEQDPSIGWSVTTLPEETARHYDRVLTQLRKALRTYRIDPAMSALIGLLGGLPVGGAAPVAPAPKVKKTIKLVTESGRKLTVPISFYEEGPIVDQATGEVFEPAE